MKKNISTQKTWNLCCRRCPYLFTKVLLLFKLAVFDLMVAIKVKCDFRQSLNPIHLRERGKKVVKNSLPRQGFWMKARYLTLFTLDHVELHVAILMSLIFHTK